MDQYIERVVDLLDPKDNQIYNLPLEGARALLMSNSPDAMLQVQGSFALLGRDGKTVRMARSLDRPMRYFLAKRKEGPVLIVASRIDAIYQQLKSEGIEGQFHPSYTRMVPAHHVTEIQLVGCPDPDPVYTRFFTPPMGVLPPDLDVIGEHYIAALAQEIGRWLDHVPPSEPIGVCFSGGVDSGAVFLTTYHLMQQRGMHLGRLKAFVLGFGQGPDVQQARAFLDAVGLRLFLEAIEADPATLDPHETIRVTEDY